MLRGWLQSKKGERTASTHSLDSLAEPQNRLSYILIYLGQWLITIIVETAMRGMLLRLATIRPYDVD
jgi:hypothetical protein